MATNRPFARNLGSNIVGTEQFGNLAVGEPTLGYQETGLDWWGGPDEELGYIIATENPLGQSAANGETAYVTFWRCESNDAAFIDLGNGLLDSSYTTANEVKTALNSAGYWTSYGLNGGGSNFQLGDYQLSALYNPANNPGDIVFPAHLLSAAGPGYGGSNPNLVGTEDATHSHQLYINSNDANENDQSSILDQLIGNSGILILTQGSNSVTYSFGSQAFKTDTFGPTQAYYYDSEFAGAPGSPIPPAPLGSLTVISPASSNFNTIDPITITIII